MHDVQCELSRGFNRRSGRTGGLWQSRYQAKLVDEQRYLSQVVLYVRLNPVRAGAAKRPADHVFSGHREIVKGVRSPLVDIDDTLPCFKDTVRTARRSYLSAIRVGCKASDGPGTAGVAAFGDLAWRESELEPKSGREHVDLLGRSTGRERPPMPADRFLDEACRLLQVEPDRLASRARDRATAEMRASSRSRVSRGGSEGKAAGCRAEQ